MGILKFYCGRLGLFLDPGRHGQSQIASGTVASETKTKFSFASAGISCE